MKHSLKSGIKLGVIIFAIMLFMPCDIKADTSSVQMNGKSTIKDNSAADKACEDAIFDDNVFEEREDTNNYYLIFKIKEGYWRLKLYYGDDINYVDVFGDENTGAKTPSKLEVVSETSTFTIPKDEYDEQQLYVVAELLGYDDDGKKIGYNSEKKPLRVTYDNGTKTTTCRYGTIGINKNKNSIKINGTGAFYRTTIKPKNTGRPTVTLANINNQEIIDECAAMQQGRYKFGEQNSDLDIPGSALNEYIAGMKKSFPFCFDQPSSFAYTADDIKKVRQASINAYREYINLKQTNSQNLGGYSNLSEYEANELNSVDEARKYEKITFKSKYKTKIGKVLQCKKDQTASHTEKYYVKNDSEVSNAYCKVACLEQIQIVYDPPVASKAGLCFQYKVTVRSKVTCEATVEGEFQWPTPPSPCEFSAICSGNSHETQAGPNEEFDSCVNSCDNGKYSQNCINKCYKKIYKNNKSKTKKTNTSLEKKNSVKKTDLSKSTNNSNLSRLSNVNGTDPYYNISGCKNNTEIGNNTVECAKQFYLLKQSDPRGLYILDANHPSWYTHIWQPDWETVDKTSGVPAGSGGDSAIESVKRAAPYYFRSISVATKTLQSFYGKNNGKNGYGKDRYYIIDNKGIKRQKGSYNCKEICGFVSSGNNDNCTNSSSEAAEYLVGIFNDRYNNLNACSAGAKCKEGQSTFNIEVKQSKGKNKDKTITWDAYNETNNDEKSCVNPGSKSDPYNIKMFIPLQGGIINGDPYSDKEDGTDDTCKNLKNGINGKCYGKDAYKYWQHYKTTITFPGTWIDLKTGRRYYTNTGVDTSITREKPNYYCIGYDEEPVNQKWWDWKINETDKETNKAPTPKKGDNIKATVENFGKYKWNFSLNCFYALSNKVTTCTGENCNPSCKGAECNTTIDNVKLRPVDQSNLFAGRSGEQVGFNWTSAAKDEVAANSSDSDAKTYGIDPGKYAESLQTEAKSNSEAAYSGDADYSIYLTKENIKALRNYADKNGYTTYEGKGNAYKEVKGLDLYYYTSGILGNKTYTKTFERKNAILGKNND